MLIWCLTHSNYNPICAAFPFNCSSFPQSLLPPPLLPPSSISFCPSPLLCIWRIICTNVDPNWLSPSVKPLPGYNHVYMRAPGPTLLGLSPSSFGESFTVKLAMIGAERESGSHWISRKWVLMSIPPARFVLFELFQRFLGCMGWVWLKLQGKVS